MAKAKVFLSYLTVPDTGYELACVQISRERAVQLLSRIGVAQALASVGATGVIFPEPVEAWPVLLDRDAAEVFDDFLASGETHGVVEAPNGLQGDVPPFCQVMATSGGVIWQMIVAGQWMETFNLRREELEAIAAG